MRKITLLFLLVTSNLLFSQIDSITYKKPEFKGGEDSLMKYFHSKFGPDSECNGENSETTVFIYVNKIGNIQFVKTIGKTECVNKKIKNLFTNSPDWIPAIKNGSAIDTFITRTIYVSYEKQRVPPGATDKEGNPIIEVIYYQVPLISLSTLTSRRPEKKSLKEREADRLYDEGTALLNSNEFSKALEKFNAAINLNKYIADYFYNRGLCFHYLQEKESACQDWNSAKKLGDNEANNLINKYCSD